MPRDTYKYHLKRGNRILKSGITNDLDRREGEHQRKYGDDVHTNGFLCTADYPEAVRCGQSANRWLAIRDESTAF